MREVQHHRVTVIHELDPDLTRLVEKIFGKVSKQLSKIQGDIKIIMATEEELDQKLAELATTATDGFTSIEKAVSDAADRVIKILQKNPVDLTDEIASVEGIKTAVSDASAKAAAELAAIAPDTPPTA